jgi:ATP-dependent RNA helicase DeaD
MKDGYNADSLHGDLNQAQRDKVMMKFRSRTVRILVATDVAARGIDVESISHVIHLNLPDEMEFYTHRSGRTARAGKKGVSIALIGPKEVSKIRQIEKTVKSKFTQIVVPSGPEICQNQLLALMKRVHDVKVNEAEIETFLPAVYDELKDLSKNDLIKRFASIEFNRFLDYYRNAPDLNIDAKIDGSERYSTGSRFFINVGKMDDVDETSLIELLDDFCKIRKKQIGKIDIKGAYSFFEVDKDVADRVVPGLKDLEYAGRTIRVELTGSEPKKERPKNKKFNKGRPRRRN